MRETVGEYSLVSTDLLLGLPKPFGARRRGRGKSSHRGEDFGRDADFQDHETSTLL